MTLFNSCKYECWCSLSVLLYLLWSKGRRWTKKLYSVIQLTGSLVLSLVLRDRGGNTQSFREYKRVVKIEFECCSFRSCMFFNLLDFLCSCLRYALCVCFFVFILLWKCLTNFKFPSLLERLMSAFWTPVLLPSLSSDPHSPLSWGVRSCPSSVLVVAEFPRWSRISCVLSGPAEPLLIVPLLSKQGLFLLGFYG